MLRHPTQNKWTLEFLCTGLLNFVKCRALWISLSFQDSSERFVRFLTALVAGLALEKASQDHCARVKRRHVAAALKQALKMLHLLWSSEWSRHFALVNLQKLKSLRSCLHVEARQLIVEARKLIVVSLVSILIFHVSLFCSSPQIVTAVRQWVVLEHRHRNFCRRKWLYESVLCVWEGSCYSLAAPPVFVLCVSEVGCWPTAAPRRVCVSFGRVSCCTLAAPPVCLVSSLCCGF